MKILSILFPITLAAHMACGQFTEPPEVANGSTLSEYANVIAVKATGDADQWRFSVTIESPDLGCEQYADWWEILDENGKLIYRRILAHSHVDEQPFTRSSTGSIEVQEDLVLWIRAHMNTSGYGGQALQGRPSTGFKRQSFPSELDQGQEKQDPLPGTCRF